MNPPLLPGPRHTDKAPTAITTALFDVDNTLVGNNSSDLPSQRFIAAAIAANATISIGLATARPLPKVEHILDACQFKGLSILCNGAQIYDANTKEMVRELTLSQSISLEICHLLQALRVGHWVEDDGVDHIWSPEISPRAYATILDIWEPTRSANKQLVPDYQPVKTLAIVAHNVTELMVDLVLAVADAFPADVTALIGHEFDHANGTKTYEVFFLHKKATKYDALLDLVAISKLPLSSVMAVGDGPNDIAFIEHAGTGVAVANAVKATKAVAQYIAPAATEDGAAIALEELILKRQ